MNWGQLKAAVAAWSNRTDLTADATILPLMLEMAEQQIFQGSRNRPGLRLQSMLTTVDPYTPGALPTGLLQIERVSTLILGYRKTLEHVGNDQFARYEGQAGLPEVYTVRGANLVVAPGASTQVQLLYYARPTLFVSDSDTNAIIDAFPGIWLYAMLAEVGNWLKDPEMVAQYRPLLDEAIEGARAQDERMRRGASAPIAIKPQLSVRV